MYPNASKVFFHKISVPLCQTNHFVKTSGQTQKKFALSSAILTNACTENPLKKILCSLAKAKAFMTDKEGVQ